jgi:hypothetical protein
MAVSGQLNFTAAVSVGTASDACYGWKNLRAGLDVVERRTSRSPAVNRT